MCLDVVSMCVESFGFCVLKVVNIWLVCDIIVVKLSVVVVVFIIM